MSIYANKGMNFESLIEYANCRYRQGGVAVITKQHTLCKPLHNGTGQVVSAKYEEKATVDFMGRFGARPIAFEAKHCSEDKIDLKRVEQHQRDFLHEWTVECDAIGFVLVSFRFEAYYLIPYHGWAMAVNAREQKKCGTPVTTKGIGMDWFLPTGKASIRRDELPDGWAVETNGNAALDYLRTVKRIWN